MHINFFCQNISFSLKKKEIVQGWVLSAIRKEKKKAGNINFIFCNDKFLLSLNKKFLKHNTLTDIITFPASPLTPLLKERGTRPARTNRFGTSESEVSAEIFISIPRVKENAKKFEVSFENELHRVMIHGILHLCGYSDKSTGKKKQMRQREDLYLKLF